MNHVIFGIIISYSLCNEIKYSDESMWPKNCFGDTQQSPINLPKDPEQYIYTFNTSLVSTFYNNLTAPSIYSINAGEKFTVLPNNDLGYVIFQKNNHNYKYTANEINFHIPSEHLIENQTASIEMQVVHTKDLSYNPELTDTDISQYLIISILFVKRRSYTNEFIRAFQNFRDVTSTKPEDVLYEIDFDDITNTTTATSRRALANTTTNNATEEAYNANTIDLNQIILPTKAYYYYTGSLTAPPCTGNANWLIQNYFYYLSEAQYNLFKEMISIHYAEGNARQVKNTVSPLYLIYNNTISINILFTSGMNLHVRMSLLIYLLIIMLI